MEKSERKVQLLIRLLLNLFGIPHIGEPTEPPTVLPARAPPQVEIDFNQVVNQDDWPDMDQTAEAADETRN